MDPFHAEVLDLLFEQDFGLRFLRLEPQNCLSRDSFPKTRSLRSMQKKDETSAMSGTTSGPEFIRCSEGCFLTTARYTQDEHIIMKWQERSGRDEEYYGSWLLEVIDGHREKRIRQVICELKDKRCPMDADPQILREIQEPRDIEWR